MTNFAALGDGAYELTDAGHGLVFAVDRLRWERNELYAQLTVTCSLPGAHTVNGQLVSQSTFNLSSTTARRDRAKHLRERVRGAIDTIGLLELLCCRVLAAERQGEPAIVLRDVPRPAVERVCNVDGFRIPQDHATIVFGDGGTAKSFHALYVGGRLTAERGLRVALFDWELDAGQHRTRLEQLFGAAMPDVRYVRCERPLVHEVDRLRKIVRDDRIDFGLFDSIGFACPGPPEAAEHAMGYFRAVRQLGIGSLHIAHVRQGDDNDRKPFGSAFWHNGARSTWAIKLAATSPDGACLTIGLFNRKSNLSALAPAVGYTVAFDRGAARFTRVDVDATPDLADGLPLWQRMQAMLRAGPRKAHAIADEIGADVETVERTVRRYKDRFTRLSGEDGVSRIALLESRRVS